MLDRRIYRSAFAVVVIAVFVAAFSLVDRPEPVRSPLGGQLFDTQRAFGTPRTPPGSSLLELGEAFPRRRPGSEGDAALAGRVATELARQRFEVERSSFEADTPDGRRELVTVSGVRPGESTRRIAVVASRDSLESPDLAGLSATAALIEIARVARTRDLRHTLELVSVSGGSIGGAGAREWAREAVERGGVDAALVLGDLASDQVRKPWVVGWSNDGPPAAAALRRTVETAVRQETGAEPGGSRAWAQWVRRAFTTTVGEQGEILGAGLPAVKLSVSGERPPGPGAEVDEERMEGMGRSVLRALSALDAAPGADPFADGVRGIVTVRRILPDWASRMLVLALLLPALVTAFDAYFRVRRRGLPTERWLLWSAAGAVPLAAAWMLARGLDLARLLDAPPGPAPAGAIPITAGAAVGFGLVLLVALGGLAAALPAASRVLGLRGRPRSTGGPAAAAGLLLTATALVVWVVNPFAAALLVGAAHLWLLAAAPETRWRVLPTAVAICGGLLLPVLAVLGLASGLALGPVDLAWHTVLSAAGGHTGLLAAMVAGVFGSTFLAVLAAARARLVVSGGGSGTAAAGDVRIRGPVSYAGPGSLGGTESALPR